MFLFLALVECLQTVDHLAGPILVKMEAHAKNSGATTLASVKILGLIKVWTVSAVSKPNLFFLISVFVSMLFAKPKVLLAFCSWKKLFHLSYFLHIFIRVLKTSLFRELFWNKWHLKSTSNSWFFRSQWWCSDLWWWPQLLLALWSQQVFWYFGQNCCAEFSHTTGRCIADVCLWPPLQLSANGTAPGKDHCFHLQ